jgi:TPR repeat protein
MPFGEVRPEHSFSIRSEDERRAVKQLLARFRQLPAEEQKRLPALLNGLGKLQLGAGDFAGARETFVEVARTVPEDAARAEASYNAYRAALEEQHWDEALQAITEAAQLDPARFTPFPLRRYEPRRILGAGGFGTAFLCLDRHFDTEVVVKTLHAADLERSTADVFQEARVLRQLSHPEIIAVRECDYADPARQARPYLVMDYFPATTLGSYLRDHGPLPAEDLVVIARQVALAMQAAHERGVLHRDLKPDNLLVRKEAGGWHVRIIDFGLALRRQASGTSPRSPASGRTVLGDSIAGTLKYAPPEQRGELPGVRPGPYSDVYAFGKVCCYALFQTTEPRTRQLSAIPVALRELLEKCIEEDLAHRAVNFAPVAEALEELLKATGLHRAEPDQELAAELQECERLLRTTGEVHSYVEGLSPRRSSAWRAAAEQGSAAAQLLLGLCAHNDAERLRWFRLAADQGYAPAQKNMGVLHMKGVGVPQDHAEALRWFRLAADQGYIPAQNNIGLMYESGLGVGRDYAEALRLFRMAADQGFATSQSNIGSMYMRGLGVPKDYTEALRWVRKAADQGNVAAQYNLGVLYMNGLGVPQDYAEALRWLGRAADQGFPAARYELGVLYMKGRGVAQDYAEALRWFRRAAEQTPADTLRWFGKAAGQSHFLSQNNIGWMYENGLGVGRDCAEAMRCYRMAADQGNATAQYNVGRIYEKGLGAVRDHAEALRWYRRAADQGHAEAQNSVGWRYLEGRGAARDYAEALRWFEKAADQGNALAQNNIGVMYKNGLGVAQDYAEALRWYRMAARRGCSLAQRNLGVMYDNGLGVRQDYEEALCWYRRAAEQGDEQAKRRLQNLSAIPGIVRRLFNA